MRLFFRHLIFIILGYILAAIAAGLVVAVLGILFKFWLPGGAYDDFFPAFLFLALIFLWVSFIPFGLLIVAAEAFRLRSVFIYALFAAAVLLISNLSFEPPSSSLKMLQTFLAPLFGGLVFGTVYWLIAGRSAGQWRGERVE